MNESQSLILIVDDNATNIDVLVRTLEKEYRLGIAKNGKNALIYAIKFQPDLILLDIMMPEMNGYDVCARLKENPKTNGIPVIFITARSAMVDKTKAFEIGAVDYITKPFHAAEIKARVKTHLTLAEMQNKLSQQNELLEQKVEKKTSEIQEMLQGSILSMSLMSEIRDPYTAGHQQRVAQLAGAIATDLGLSATIIEGIRIAAILHDVGKIRTPVSILTRTGELLEAEMAVIKIHSQVGFEILKNIPFPWPCAQMVLQHHERLDGSGYPFGLRGNEILLESKILAVADVTEAISSFRPYRPAQGINAALEEIKKFRDITYDADVVDTCLRLFKTSSFQFNDTDDGVQKREETPQTDKTSPMSTIAAFE